MTKDEFIKRVLSGQLRGAEARRVAKQLFDNDNHPEMWNLSAKLLKEDTSLEPANVVTLKMNILKALGETGQHRTVDVIAALSDCLVQVCQSNGLDDFRTQTDTHEIIYQPRHLDDKRSTRRANGQGHQRQPEQYSRKRNT